MSAIQKTLIVTVLPTAYRVDFFNKLTTIYGDKLSIAFVPSGREPHKSLIFANSSEPFWELSTLYSQNSMKGRILALLKDTLRFRPDVIVVTGFPPHMLPLSIYGGLVGADLYTWFAGTRQSEERLGKLRYFYRRMLSRVLKGAVLYSDFSRSYLHEVNPSLRNVMVLGNNTRDAAGYAKKVARYRQQGSKSGAITFITVGFQAESKNTELLIRAFAQIRGQGMDANLWIVGDGDDLPRLKKITSELEVDRVTFVGSRDPEELPEIYARADVLVHPSSYDRWPQVYNEAAAAGLALLISTRTGVWDSYIEKNYEQVVFSWEDESQLYRQMAHLINNPRVLTELKQSAFETALSTDCSVCVERWTSLFDITMQAQ